MSLAISIGIDIGQRHEASAIAVVETQWRQVGRQHTAHFITRTLTRLSAGTPYTAIAARLGEVLTGVQQRMAKEAPPREQTSLLPDGTRVHTVASWQALPVYADATGIGQPVLDLLATPGVRIIPTYFNHGDRRLVDEQGIITLGKGWLVTRLKVLLQTGQLLLPPHQGRWWDALGHPHGQGGLSVMDGNLYYGRTAGKLDATIPLVQDASVPCTVTVGKSSVGSATGPFPPNTIIRIYDGNHHSVGGSPNGEFMITATSTDGKIHLCSTGGVTSSSDIYVIQYGPAVDPSTSSTGAGTSTGTTPPAQMTTPSTSQTGGKALPTPSTFPVYPIASVKQFGYYQPFGPSSFAGEPPACGAAHFHAGVDISTGVSLGTPIRSATTGVVIWATYGMDGYGFSTIIETGSLQILYGHQSEIDVKVGDQVQAGQFIGRVGSTGNSTGPHLHFGVKDLRQANSCRRRARRSWRCS